MTEPQVPNGAPAPPPTAPQDPPRPPTSAAATPTSASPARTDDVTKQPAAADRDPTRELLERMTRMIPLVAQAEPGLAKAIQALANQSNDAERRVQPGFRHEVAYALQDLEKVGQAPIAMSPALRSEMTRLAGGAVGLENDRMIGLIRATPEIPNLALVRELRSSGTDIGRYSDQSSPDLQSRIDALENKVRLAARGHDSAAIADTPAKPGDGRPETQSSPTPDRAPFENQAGSTRRQGYQQVRPDVALPHHTQAGSGNHAQSIVINRTPLDVILDAVRPKDNGIVAPWETQHTPMRDRFAAFERDTQEKNDRSSIERAEKSGRAALQAIQAFSSGDAAAVMNRVHDAAKSEPGGIAAVLAEMRQGGKFQDLRQQFNAALAEERGAGAAYDKAAAALARYSEWRPAIEQVIGRRADATNLAAKFEQLDAEIGEAAGRTPSRRDGKAMIEDLSKAATELLQRAVEGLKAIFSRSPSADATARLSPGPSPGPSP